MRLKVLIVLSFVAAVFSGWLFFRRPTLPEIIQDVSKKKYNVLLMGYLFLAQALVERGSETQKAIEYAEKGLSLDPGPEYRPLGHLVLADIYNRMGRRDLEMQHLRLAKQK